jgi:hypothetical protein
MMKSGRMRWGWYVAPLGENRGAYRVYPGKPRGKRPLGRPRRGWDCYIKISLREMAWGAMDWIHLAQYRDYWWALVNMVMNI